MSNIIQFPTPQKARYNVIFSNTRLVAVRNVEMSVALDFISRKIASGIHVEYDIEST